MRKIQIKPEGKKSTYVPFTQLLFVFSANGKTNEFSFWRHLPNKRKNENAKI